MILSNGRGKKIKAINLVYPVFSFPLVLDRDIGSQRILDPSFASYQASESLLSVLPTSLCIFAAIYKWLSDKLNTLLITQSLNVSCNCHLASQLFILVVGRIC